MTPADVRLTAQLVVDKRVHCVTDDSVMALARRVLELESDAEEHAANVRHVEREACAKLGDREAEVWEGYEANDVLASDRHQHHVQARTARDIAAAIRARGAK